MSSSGDHSDPAGLFGSCTEGPHLWSAVPLIIAVAFVEIPDRSYRNHETVALTPHDRAVFRRRAERTATVGRARAKITPVPLPPHGPPLPGRWASRRHLQHSA